jgi:outer membrane receptor for ferrienterochelin and colicins
VNSRSKGIPTASFDMTFNDPRAQSHDQHQFVELQYTNDLSNNKNIFVRGYYDSYKYRGQYPLPSMYTRDETHVESGGAEARFRWDLSTGNRLILGSEYKDHFGMQYKGWYDESLNDNNNFPYRSFSVYLQDELQLFEDLQLTIGIRRDHYSSIGNVINPRCSIVAFPFVSTTLKLLYGEAFRRPNIYEMFYEDMETPHIANLKLAAEKIRMYEIVLEQRFGLTLLGIISVFNYEMNNLIDLMIDPSTSIQQFQNRDRIRSTGFESSLIYSFNSRWKGYLNYSLQRTKDVGTDLKLTNSPSHIAQCGIVFPVFKEISAAMECRYESERLTLYRKAIAPLFLVNMNIAVQTPSQHLRGSFLIRDLFNASYVSPAGIDNDPVVVIPQDRRTYTVRLEYSL